MKALLDHAFLSFGFLLMLVNQYHGVLGSKLIIEGEDMDNVRDSMHVYRSKASNRRSVIMHNFDTVYFEFCLMSATRVTVESLTYSNDGGGDHVLVSVDSNVVWSFHTVALSDGGNGWNKFVKMEKKSEPLLITEGRHRISIEVQGGDSFGVEIDNIEIETNNVQSVEALKCSIFCFDDITYIDDIPYQTTTPIKATAVQASVNTSCAEEDNVNIPVFHENVSKFVVSASIPKYTTFLNNRGADWTDCKMAQAFWKFRHVNIGQRVTETQIHTAKMKISFTTDYILDENIFTALIDFDLEGPSIGSTDSEIGTRVHLKGIRFSEILRIEFQYLGRARKWSTIETQFFEGSSQDIIFETPDFSFLEGGGNQINMKLYTSSYLSEDIYIDELYMVKRYLKRDDSKTLFKDSTTVIEGVDIDMWWRMNETMTVSLTSDLNNTFANVDYLRIYQRVPWSNDSYSQVFVLYQDGNVRLLPLTPHGLDWIPFGSSVLIGQSDSSSYRPSAPINHLEIDPHNLSIKLFYLDGGTIFLKIETTLHETRLVIHDSVFKRNLAQYPFFTLRSMWIRDGNADVDHITVDGKDTRNALGQWRNLQGSFFAFYRKCISKHNTLSPDIRLKVVA